MRYLKLWQAIGTGLWGVVVLLYDTLDWLLGEFRGGLRGWWEWHRHRHIR
jgi:hypothetical protein